MNLSSTKTAFDQFKLDIKDGLENHGLYSRQEFDDLFTISRECEDLCSLQGLTENSKTKTKINLQKIIYRTPLGPFHIIPTILAAEEKLSQAIKSIEKGRKRVVTTGTISTNSKLERDKNKAFVLLEIPVSKNTTAIWYFSYSKMQIMNVYRLSKTNGIESQNERFLTTNKTNQSPRELFEHRSHQRKEIASIIEEVHSQNLKYPAKKYRHYQNLNARRNKSWPSMLEPILRSASCRKLAEELQARKRNHYPNQFSD